MRIVLGKVTGVHSTQRWGRWAYWYSECTLDGRTHLVLKTYHQPQILRQQQLVASGFAWGNRLKVLAYKNLSNGTTWKYVPWNLWLLGGFALAIPLMEYGMGRPSLAPWLNLLLLLVALGLFALALSIYLFSRKVLAYAAQEHPG
jgi:hypothetical protein